jgi:hypothetical protein
LRDESKKKANPVSLSICEKNISHSVIEERQERRKNGINEQSMKWMLAKFRISKKPISALTGWR